MKIRCIATPPNNESYNIKFVSDNGQLLGDGLMGKVNSQISLIRCPDCGRENYAPSVLSGICSWCNFDAKNCPMEL